MTLSRTFQANRPRRNPDWSVGVHRPEHARQIPLAAEVAFDGTDRGHVGPIDRRICVGPLPMQQNGPEQPYVIRAVIEADARIDRAAAHRPGHALSLKRLLDEHRRFAADGPVADHGLEVGGNHGEPGKLLDEPAHNKRH